MHRVHRVTILTLFLVVVSSPILYAHPFETPLQYLLDVDNPRGGTTMASSDLNSDDIITGAGPGAVYGPHVRGWNYDGATVTPRSRDTASLPGRHHPSAMGSTSLPGPT